MILTFTVISHEHCSRFNDGLHRITLRCDQADAINRSITMAVPDLTLYPLGTQYAFSATRL